MLAGSGDAVGVGQLLDEGDLPLDGPAVVARTEVRRFEFNPRRGHALGRVDRVMFGHCASR
jgi:hypothetical protein